MTEHRQLVMDHTGHSPYAFNPADSMSTKEAMDRFAELTGNGYTAAKTVAPGKHEAISEFDPTAEQTIFFQRLVGG